MIAFHTLGVSMSIVSAQGMMHLLHVQAYIIIVLPDEILHLSLSYNLCLKVGLYT